MTKRVRSSGGVVLWLLEARGRACVDLFAQRGRAHHAVGGQPLAQAVETGHAVTGYKGRGKCAAQPLRL